MDSDIAKVLLIAVKEEVLRALPQFRVSAQAKRRLDFEWQASTGLFYKAAVRIMDDTDRFVVNVWWSTARKAAWSGGADPEVARATPDRGVSLARLCFRGYGFVPSWAVGEPDPSPARKNDMTFPTAEAAAKDVASKLVEFAMPFLESSGPSK